MYTNENFKGDLWQYMNKYVHVTITIHYIINSDRSENQKRERTVRKRN